MVVIFEVSFICFLLLVFGNFCANWGVVLGPLGAPFGAYWLLLGASRGYLAASWEPLGAKKPTIRLPESPQGPQEAPQTAPEPPKSLQLSLPKAFCQLDSKGVAGDAPQALSI